MRLLQFVTRGLEYWSRVDFFDFSGCPRKAPRKPIRSIASFPVGFIRPSTMDHWTDMAEVEAGYTTYSHGIPSVIAQFRSFQND